MTTTVLVAYATKYGSTREVAEAIAATLSLEGLEVEIQPAREVRSLDGYGAVVLGAALYMGRWHKDARRFLKRHRAALSQRQVAIFALGPLSAAEEDRRGSREQLDRALAQVPWLTPVEVEMFGGMINPAQLHFPFNHMPAGDARDWKAIRAWASKLAAQLRPQPVLADTSTPALVGG
ncbi:MAG TPA: flavodoxin domain-containing protein [Ktedonobacteraceae bacterium]|nr:flavodoxin domain-containing protein [Ktedonobacteraceae bacterium]